MQTVTSADGTRIAFEREGAGPPLVLLHGGGTHLFWQPYVHRFVDDFTVVRPDRRGHGTSGDKAPYGIDREVEDVLAVIDALDSEPVLFGHSFGGLQAIEAAHVAPVEKVIAYEPAYLVGEYREQADLAARMQERLENGDRHGAMKLHLREVVGSSDSWSDFDEWLEAWRGWPDCVDNVENTVRMDRALEEHRIPEPLDVDVPVLLLTGEEGPSHLRDSIRAVNAALPNSRLVEFEGLSHLGLSEDPARVAETGRPFLFEETVKDQAV